MSDSDVEMATETLATGLVTPGELVTDESGLMRGHGTYGEPGSDAMYSAVAGTIERVNKLVHVQALHGRYIPNIGDHVVGRVTEVGNSRWKVDVGASQDGILQLGALNLPGGINRRKSDEDQLQMRTFLKEGDLINAEIHGQFGDGAPSLQMRSVRYGKLRNGMFVKVPSSLVLRLRTQVHRLQGGVEVILGVNGYIWIRRANPNEKGSSMDVPITRLELESNTADLYKDENDDLPASIRRTISRYANCIQALVYKEMGINAERLEAVYEASLAYPDAGELLANSVKEELVRQALASLAAREAKA